MEQSLKMMIEVSEAKKFTKEEALNFINFMSNNKGLSILSQNLSSYLMGYSINETKLTDTEIQNIQDERIRKHNKAVKYAKKKKLEIPVLDDSPIELYKIELTAHPYGRNVKEDFIPQIKGYVLFEKIINEIEKYQVFNIELRGKKNNQREADEMRLMRTFDPVYKHQGHIVRAWNMCKVDYLLATNNVIFNEVIRDYATLIAYLTEYKKLVNKLLKPEPRLLDVYNQIFKDFNPKANWFSFAFEDALTLCASCDVSNSVSDFLNNGVQCDLTESKKIFWDTFKEETKTIKSYFNQ